MNSRTRFLAHAIIVGLVFAFPHLHGLLRAGSSYTPFSISRGVSALVGDETASYAPAPRKLLRAGQLSGELRVYELRGAPNGYPTLPTLFIAAAARITGSLENAWMALDFILPMLTWLLVCLLAGRFTQSTALRESIAWLFVLIPFGPRNALLLGQYSLQQPLELSRLPQPSFSFPLLLAAVACTAWAVESPRKIRIALAGILGGALFYTYYYAWLAAAGAIVVALVTFACLHEWKNVRATAAAGLIAGLIGSPYLIAAAGLSADPGTHALMARVGAFTHAPDRRALLVAVAVLIAFATYFGRRRAAASRPLLVLLASTAFAGALFMNLHVITGYDPQHGHFLNRIVQPFVFLCVLFGAAGFLESSVARRRTVAVLAGVMVLLGVIRQVAVARNTLPQHLRTNPEIQALEWIRDHASADDVIASLDPAGIVLTPALTGNWTFVPFGEGTTAVNHEIVLRFWALSQMLGVSHAQRDSLVSADGGNSWLRLPYVLELHQKPAALLDSLHVMDVQVAADSVLRRRRMDYVVMQRGLAHVPPANARRVYFNREWVVYRL